MRHHLLTFLLIISSLSVSAQLSPVHNVASPDAGTLGTFGTVPVSHYTGVPDISIPLYEVKVGDFTLPLTARYHLSSVKPHTPPTTLGLGWVLDAGGYISRTVRGLMDEQHGTDEATAGFYESCSTMQYITPENFSDFVVADISEVPLSSDDTEPSIVGELAADEFSFSFCGHSGTFYRNSEGGWTVISDEDIKVEFDEQSGFMPLDSLQGRINTSMWGRKDVCNRFFRMFTLVTPDGYRWVFGGAEATEFSISYYHRDENDLVPTTWRLSKVITPEGRTLTLKYNADHMMCHLMYSPQEQTVETRNSAYLSGTIGYQISNTGLSGYTGFLLFPVSLNQISSPNDTLQFTYYNDPLYGSRYYYYGHKALGWFNANMTRHDAYMASITPSSNQFLSLLHTTGSTEELSNENIMRAVISDNLRNPLLHRIVVKDRSGDAQHSIYFDYDKSSRTKLSMITAREGCPPIQENVRFVPDAIGMIRTGYRVPELIQQESAPATYYFRYHKNNMPISPVLAATDAWGYSIGGTQSLSSFPFYSRTTNPNLHATLAETLSSIIYPTGGQTLFTYELHDYCRELSARRDSVSAPANSNSQCGGLRLKEIANRDKLGNVINTTHYYYTDSLGSNVSSGILQSKPSFQMLYNISGQTRIEIRSSECFGAPSTHHNTPDVGYSSVIEQTRDADGNSLGYTRYRYSNFDADIYGDTHFDHPPLGSAHVSGFSPITPFTSRSMERGKLIQKEIFDADGMLKYKERVRYENTSDNYMTTVNHSLLHWFFILDNGMMQNVYTVFGWLNKTYTYSCLPVERHITEYYSPSDSLTRSTFLTYNRHKLVASDSTVSSTGGMSVTHYRYVGDDDSGRYAWMQQQHFLSAKTCIQQQTDNMRQTDSITYAIRQSPHAVPYVSKVTSTIDNGPEQIRYEVLETDEYGNPVRLTENGVPSRLTWCYDGQRLEDRTIGTYDDTTSSAFPQYSYWYDNSLRPKKVQEPGKPIRYYYYDAYGRLIHIEGNDNQDASAVQQVPIRDYRYEFRKVE